MILTIIKIKKRKNHEHNRKGGKEQQQAKKCKCPVDMGNACRTHGAHMALVKANI